jgi:hypothetical protein
MPDVPNGSSKLPSAHAKRLGWALDKYGHLLVEGNRCLAPTLRLGLLMLRSAPLK